MDNFKKWPHFDSDDIKAVSEVLKSGKINRWTGSKNLEFEKKFSEYIGVRHCIAVSNGTLALELALEGLCVGPGDEVITTCRTFMASASAAVMRGARPVVVDIDENSQCLSPDAIRRAVTGKTKAIIAVHHAGMPCDMDSIMKIAREKKLFVIEDCAQAHGAVYKGRKVGGIGDVGAWSFCQDKIISSGGEGGAVTTNNTKVWKKMWSFKDHGRNYDLVYSKKTFPVGFRWFLESFGSNYRMTEMQAVLAMNGLSHLEEWVDIRNRNAEILTSFIKPFKFARVPVVPDGVRCAYYKYYFFVDESGMKKGWSAQRVIEKISSRGIPAFSGTCWNISNEKCFKKAGWSKSASELPVAAKIGRESVMLLVHPTLTTSDMRRAGKVVSEVLKEASRD